MENWEKKNNGQFENPTLKKQKKKQTKTNESEIKKTKERERKRVKGNGVKGEQGQIQAEGEGGDITKSENQKKVVAEIDQRGRKE